MDNDFLKRAKADVIHAYMNRCIDAEGTPAEAFFRKVKDTVVALIDSALAEPDADVAEVVQKLMDWNTESTGGGCDCEKCKALRLVCDAASRQYQKPKLCRLCNDEIDHEDVDLCSACINTLELYQKPTDEAPTVGDMHDYALRQMRYEPCEWCKHDEYVQRLMDEMQSSKVYCPNCGRKLVK